MKLSPKDVSTLVSRALREDLGEGDLTSRILPNNSSVNARIVAKQKLLLCGTSVVREVFSRKGCTITLSEKEGSLVRSGTPVARIRGRVRDLLSAERVALNFLQHMSGVATLTAEYVKRAGEARIYDTRKTLPGLRVLQKYAVKCGGGWNHRMGLYDQVLIKDNHLEVLSEEELSQRLSRMPRPIEIEAATEKQALSFARLPVDIILLDNFSPVRLRKLVRAVRKVNSKVILEASGGVNLKTVRAIGRTGVDRISVGAITHSVPAVDFSLLI